MECGYRLTIVPGEGPEYCPACERMFTVGEMRQMWDRTIHSTGPIRPLKLSSPLPSDSEPSELYFND